jgi:SNF2 family DNA or RNA helicase
MGLGKTIQTIGLILSTMNADNQPDTAQCVPQEQGSALTNNTVPKKLTLIVTPLALIQQWAAEIQSKTEDGKLRVLIHHGQSRTKGKVRGLL